MKVKELIEKLQAFDPEKIVIVEDNNYNTESISRVLEEDEDFVKIEIDSFFE